MDVSKNRGVSPKMDCENNGKPYFLMDDFGGTPLFLETPICRTMSTLSLFPFLLMQLKNFLDEFDTFHQKAEPEFHFLLLPQKRRTQEAKNLRGI